MKSNRKLARIKTRASGLVVGSFLLLVAFQNCGKAGFDSNLDEGIATNASTDPNLAAEFGSQDAAKVTSVPFAYDVTFDQIAYSSCFGAGLQSKPGHFTFRAGAYSTGGVKVRQAFFDYLKANFKPIAPATELSDNQIKTYMSKSPENNSAAPQFAIRTRGRPQVVRTSSSKATVGFDYINMLDNFNNDRMMDPLVKNRTTMTSFFPFATQHSQRTLEATLSYNSTEALSAQVRQDFQNNAMLATTFVDKTGDGYAARIPASATDSTTKTTDLTRAYGTGYVLKFSAELAPYTSIVYGATVPKYNNPSNILTSIQEVNLENTSVSTSAKWTCASERRYLIVRTQDAAIQCPKEKIDLMTGATYRQELEIVRRQLPAESWDVNIALRCVVPKEGSCYASETKSDGTLIPIQYNQANECYQGLADAQAGYVNPASPPVNRCAQYVSICTRDN